jgi:hypothetical protein
MLAQVIKIARGAHVAGYDVLVTLGTVVIHRDGTTTRYSVPNYGTDIAELLDRPAPRVGWGHFPDGDEVIYLEPVSNTRVTSAGPHHGLGPHGDGDRQPPGGVPR